MYYYLYQITNLVNNKIYVGVHKTKSLNDGYMGSGKVLKYAIEKHGLENFRKDILEFFSTSEEMYAREKEVVTDEFLLREDVYNLRRGGHGGFDYLNKTGKNVHAYYEKAGIAGANGLRKSFETEDEYKNYMKSLAAKGNKIARERNDNFKTQLIALCEKAQSIEAKAKRKQTFEKIGHQQGEKNSQYGKIWIYNLETLESIRISSAEIVPSGWVKGRKIKSKNV